jgi:hypothetical protein
VTYVIFDSAIFISAPISACRFSTSSPRLQNQLRIDSNPVVGQGWIEQAPIDDRNRPMKWPCVFVFSSTLLRSDAG